MDTKPTPVQSDIIEIRMTERVASEMITFLDGLDRLSPVAVAFRLELLAARMELKACS